MFMVYWIDINEYQMKLQSIYAIAFVDYHHARPA
jgi:hypothetical protein